jgi:hypothetical protein
MKNSQYEELKEEYIKHLVDVISETGGLFPHITIFADVLNPKEDEKDKPAIIHIPIPDKFMKDDESKDEFIDQIIPDIFKDLKKKFNPHGVAWSSEGWMRQLEKGDKMPDNYKNLPIKKEVIIVTLGTKEKEEAIIYEVKREGKQVNQSGDLVDIVKLDKLDADQPDSVGGRFSGLFKKFKD